MSAPAIVTLSARPDLLPAAARLSQETWGQEDSPAEIEAGLRDPAEVFEGWVALPPEAKAGDICGMALLVACDLEERPELTPWLAGVAVVPAFRRRGIASRLVRAVEAGAAERGIARLYLHTQGAQRLYRRLGWRDLEEARTDDGAVTIMDKVLA